ncbi:ribosomal protein L30 [Xylariaceae sp. FL0804]|nr:ribosomal protein L30 [Xylariaceae sp. FL0804]
MSTTTFFRITLQRSAIGLPRRTRGALAALGLHRRGRTVFHPAEPHFAGMVMKVKELVAVEEVDRPQTTRELRDERRPDPGFYVERRAADTVPE